MLATLGKNPTQKIASLADAMLMLGEGCTRQDLKTRTGCTDADLDSHGDAARAMAYEKSVSQTRARVPARKAA